MAVGVGLGFRLGFGARVWLIRLRVRRVGAAPSAPRTRPPRPPRVRPPRCLVRAEVRVRVSVRLRLSLSPSHHG